MKKKFVIVGVLGTLLIGSITALYATTGEQREAASQLETYRSAVRKLGLPTTVREVRADKSIRPEDNAAPLIIVAAGLLASEESSQEEVIETLLAAADKPECQFDWDIARDDGFVHSLMISDAVALLLSSAREDISEENHVEATKKIIAAEKLTRHTSSIPTPEALAESARAERKLIVLLGDIMHELPKDREVMLVALEIGKITRPVGSLRTSLRSQVAAGSKAATTIGEANVIEKIRGGFPADPWGPQAVESRHLETWLEVYGGLEKIDSWIATSKYLDTVVEDWSKDDRPSSYTLRELDNDFNEAVKLVAENVALRRILFVAASVFDQARIHDQFNPELPVLGELSIDPFRDEAFDYGTMGTGFTLYSWGYDRLDSGGTTDAGFTFEDGDIGYRYSPSARTAD